MADIGAQRVPRCQRPLRRFALILPPEGARVNVGYVYARGAVATGGGLASLLWDVVRRLRHARSGSSHSWPLISPLGLEALMSTTNRPLSPRGCRLGS